MTAQAVVDILSCYVLSMSCLVGASFPVSGASFETSRKTSFLHLGRRLEDVFYGFARRSGLIFLHDFVGCCPVLRRRLFRVSEDARKTSRKCLRRQFSGASGESCFGRMVLHLFLTKNLSSASLADLCGIAIESGTVQNGCRRIDRGSHSVIARYAPPMRPAVWYRIPAEPGRSRQP